MVPGDENRDEQGLDGADAPAGEAEAPAAPATPQFDPAAHTPFRGSPGGVFKMVNGKRTRVA